MITNKHLKKLGFTFIGKRAAYLQLKDCKAIIIGSVITFTEKPPYEPRREYILEGLSREALERNIRIYNINYPIEIPVSIRSSEIQRRFFYLNQ